MKIKNIRLEYYKDKIKQMIKSDAKNKNKPEEVTLIDK